MSELLAEYWPVILIAVAIGIIVGMLMLRPRQRITLTDSAPVRPHMAVQPRSASGEGEGVADEIAAAASDVVGDFIQAPVHQNLPGADGAPDDLERLKGVGPKFAGLLQAQGIRRYEQIANLAPADIDRLDRQLGAFRGRLTRDRVVEQAQFLARGDTAGFERNFGKL